MQQQIDYYFSDQDQDQARQSDNQKTKLTMTDLTTDRRLTALSRLSTEF